MPVDKVVLDGAQRARLAGSRFAKVVELPEATSTNTVALEEAAAGAAEGLVVVAEYQSAGRGRFQRSWEAPPGKSLLFSVLVRPSEELLPPRRRHLAVAAVSLALAEGAGAVAGVGVSVKWPNDLMAPEPISAGGQGGPPTTAGSMAGRKVAGILAEAAAGDALVVGAGLNVAWAPEGATSLEELAAHPIDRGEVLVAALLTLDELYGRWDEVARLYRGSCSTIGREVVVSFAGGEHDLRGTAVDVDADGRLLVRAGPEEPVPGRIVAVAAGDVAHATTRAPGA